MSKERPNYGHSKAFRAVDGQRVGCKELMAFERPDRNCFRLGNRATHRGPVMV